jgi:hypothetical protein
MVLASARVEDFDRFFETFSSKGAAKREQHGSRGARVFRDPNDANRVWIVFDWEREGFEKLLSDREMPAILQEGGLQGRPQIAEPAGDVES